MPGRYRTLFRHDGVPYLLASVLLARLGTPMLSVALLLAAVDAFDSYTIGGSVLAAHAFALALAAPVAGRLADRYGPRRVLPLYFVVHLLAYGLQLFAASNDVAPVVAIVSAAVLGASTPPLSSVVRACWPVVVPAGSLRTAYALDSSINELAFIVGPALVSLLLLGMSAQQVVVLAGAGVLIGVAMLVMSRSLRLVPAHSRAAEPGRRLARLLGPLADRQNVVLLTIAALDTFVQGCMRIAMVAGAIAFGTANSAGLLAALLSVGALVGALSYGARSPTMSGRSQLMLLSVLAAAALAADAYAPTLLVLAVLLTVTGLVFGPRDVLQQLLLAENTSARHRAEIFSWLNTFMWAGYGVGTTFAGGLTSQGDNGYPGFTAAAVAAGVSAPLIAICYRPKRPSGELDTAGHGAS